MELRKRREQALFMLSPCGESIGSSIVKERRDESLHASICVKVNEDIMPLQRPNA